MKFSSKTLSCLLTAALIGAALSACKSEQAAAPLDPQKALLERGRSVYMSACIACHSADPMKPGTLGPEVAGSSKELLEARILRADYPPGYTPKRTSRTMIALPHLKNELEGLAAYLSSVK